MLLLLLTDSKFKKHNFKRHNIQQEFLGVSALLEFLCSFCPQPPSSSHQADENRTKSSVVK